MTGPDGFSVRLATAADAATIAFQRGRMFVDMGSLTPEGAAAQQDLWTAWLQNAIPAGDYVGFLVQAEGEAVAGVGMMFRAKMPSARDPSLTQGYVMNMYVAPEHRRRGLAEALMRTVFAEAHARGVRSPRRWAKEFTNGSVS